MISSSKFSAAANPIKERAHQEEMAREGDNDIDAGQPLDTRSSMLPTMQSKEGNIFWI